MERRAKRPIVPNLLRAESFELLTDLRHRRRVLAGPCTRRVRTSRCGFGGAGWSSAERCPLALSCFIRREISPRAEKGAVLPPYGRPGAAMRPHGLFVVPHGRRGTRRTHVLHLDRYTGHGDSGHHGGGQRRSPIGRCGLAAACAAAARRRVVRRRRMGHRIRRALSPPILSQRADR